MNQYMVIHRADAATEGGAEAGAEALPDMFQLQPSAAGARIRLDDGDQVQITRQPAIDPRETVAGFAIIDAASKGDAVARAQAWAVPPSTSAELEVRLMGCPGGCAELPLPVIPADANVYAVILRSDANLEGEVLAPQARLDAVDVHCAIEARAGTLLSAAGLRASALGARVRHAGGRSTVLDGPFTEIKELIAGYWLIRADSLDQAIAWACRNSYPSGPKVEVEVRALVRPGAAAFTPALRAAEQQMRAAQLESALHAQLAGLPGGT